MKRRVLLSVIALVTSFSVFASVWAFAREPAPAGGREEGAKENETPADVNWVD